MGTRSVIAITGAAEYSTKQTVRLYKHWDGYPTGNLPIIADALETAAKALAEHNANKTSKYWFEKTITPAILSAWTVGASTSVHGVGCREEFTASELLKPEHLGDQGDIEWIYVVDLDAKTVSVYSGEFGTTPQEKYLKGPVNLATWLQEIRSEYRADAVFEYETARRKIKSAGFELKQ
jgi:hypothetical protein